MTEQLPTKEKIGKVINDEFHDEEKEIPTTVIKERNKGHNYYIKTETDGSTTYLTKGQVIQHENLIIKWQKNTYNTWIFKYRGTEYKIIVDDGKGINIKSLE